MIYETKRKTNMVSGQEIWLWLGYTLRMAGMGSNGSLYGFAVRSGCTLTSWQAFRPFIWVGHSFGICYDYYLSHKRRETTLTSGKD